MTIASFQTTFLNDLFGEFSANRVKYCILRNYEGLPRKVKSKDIDILVDRKNFNKAIEILKVTATRNKIVYFYLNEFQGIRCFTLFRYFNKKVIRALKIDFFVNFENRGVKFLRCDDIISKIVPYKNLYIINPAQEAIINWLKPLITGNVLKAKYEKQILKAIMDNPMQVKKYMIKILGIPLTRKLWPLLINGNLQATLKLSKTIKMVAWLRNTLYDPIASMQGVIEHLHIEIRRRISPKKQMIVIIGPDGSGKSTVANQLQDIICEIFKWDKKKMRTLHFRPNLLPNIQKLVTFWRSTDTSGDFANPHRAKPSNFVISLFRLFYYFLDYTFGYLVKVYPLLGKLNIILFDRYYYDFIIDPSRSRIKLPRFIPMLLLKLIPKPTLTVLIDNDVDTILHRKQELPVPEIERQIAEYRSLIKYLPNATCVNGRKPIVDIVEEIAIEYIKKITIPVDRML